MGTATPDARPRTGRLARLKKVAFRLAAVGITLCVTLLVVEIGLRILGYRPDSGTSYLADDDGLTWVPKASATNSARGPDYEFTVTTNSLGLRGAELGPASRGRILVLGDSYTFGVGVDDGDCFPARLQELLDASQHGEWEVVNAGVSGYGATQSKLRAQRIWKQVQPRAVVYVHCGNDFSDDLRFELGVYQELRNRLPVRRFLKEHSIVYGLCKPRALALLANLGVYDPPSELEAAGEGGLVSRLGDEWKRGRDLTCGSLTEIDERAKGTGARFFVTSVGFTKNGAELGFSSDALAIIEYAGARGIPFIDPRAPFREYDVQAWYNPNSAGHFSELGNRLFAAALHEGLEADASLSTPKVPR